LKKRPQIFEMLFVLRVVLNFFRRPAIRFGLRHDPRGHYRNPRFASFLAQSNRKSNTDFHDAVLHGRKLARQALVLLLLAGGAWVAVESARALTLF
jgi:hypothetical protein